MTGKEKIVSVGIDIGTSTTSVVFSHIYVENTSGAARAPTYKIVDKQVIYRSPIYFTPLLSNTRLDTEKIVGIVTEEYKSAGIEPKDVDTGAVIITGDTARKENAEEVLNGISALAGDFVVATAGPELESIIAGKGSGADQLSSKQYTTVANLDLGGGTTNVSVFNNGDTKDAACFDIGGRLIRFVPGTLKIDYIFRKLKELGENLGMSLDVGTIMTVDQVSRICDDMAQGIIDIIHQDPQSPRYKFYATGDSKFAHSNNISKVTFSGGVGDIIYRKEHVEDFAYGDIGVVLARAIKKRLESAPDIEVIEPSETIGATVVGAGTHTTEVSGSTITISDPALLPLQNLPIIIIEENEIDNMTEAVKKKLGWLYSGDERDNVAFYIEGSSNVTFDEVQQLADKLAVATKEIYTQNKMLIVVLYNDFAKVLGQALRARLPAEIGLIVVDSVDVSEGDYIDLGRPLGMGSTLPVIVKTIVFNY